MNRVTGSIGHDEAAWSEGRYVAAVWFQTTTDLAVRTGFTLPISVQQLTETETRRAWDRASDAEAMFQQMRAVSAHMRESLTRQYSYWVGYHNELQHLACMADAWVKAGQVADDAQAMVRGAVETAQIYLLAEMDDA